MALSSPGPDLDEIHEREGVEVSAVKMSRNISPPADLLSLCRLIGFFRREKPVMVHSITPKAGLLTMTASWLCRVPVRVHTFTGLVFPTASGLKRRLLKITDRLTCAFATHIVPEGEGVKRDLIRNNITRKSLEVLGFGNIKGVDTAVFDPGKEDVLAASVKLRKEGCFTFVFVGRLTEEKGIREMVEAFKSVSENNPNVRLVLVGWKEFQDPRVNAEFERELSSNPKIEFVGFQEDIRPWLAASDVLLLPSYREGFPNVVIEGGAMGLPSVVTDINGANEIIEDGVNGLIVTPRDSHVLADAMERLMSDGKLREEMSRRARPMIQSRFEQEYVRGCLLDFYRSLLQVPEAQNDL